jgi:2-polyprenyl-3-methyl-5-hydroxy-6-metoxy-1,4-benzoquinol methylase
LLSFSGAIAILIGEFPSVRGKMQKAATCKVCGSPAKYVFSLEQGDEFALEVHLCPGCGLLFVGNTPSEKLAQASGPQYFAEIATETHRKSLHAIEDVTSLIANVSDPFVCDLGCGDGQFLELLRHANPELRVCGSELSKPRAAAARSRGFHIIEHAIGEEANQFSLVTMLDVAEHVANPVEVFTDCQKALVPHGQIYIHTPCRCFWDSLSLLLIRIPGLRKVGLKWLKTRVSAAHLQLWTSKSLKLALTKAGFRVSRLTRELELSWPLESYVAVYLRKNSKMPAFLIHMAGFLANLVFIKFQTLKNKAICVGIR